jgi:hypothetical protein
MKVLLPYSHARHNYLVPKDQINTWVSENTQQVELKQEQILHGNP